MGISLLESILDLPESKSIILLEYFRDFYCLISWGFFFIAMISQLLLKDHPINYVINVTLFEKLNFLDILSL